MIPSVPVPMLTGAGSGRALAVLGFLIALAIAVKSNQNRKPNAA